MEYHVPPIACAPHVLIDVVHHTFHVLSMWYFIPEGVGFIFLPEGVEFYQITFLPRKFSVVTPENGVKVRR